MITPYLLTKAVVPAMRERGAGWIVNITSAIVDTDQLDSPQQARSSTYAPSKAALDRLTISFATELRGNRNRGERARARARGRDRRGDGSDGPARRSGASPSTSWPMPRSRSCTCDPAARERTRRAFGSVPAGAGRGRHDGRTGDGRRQRDRASDRAPARGTRCAGRRRRRRTATRRGRRPAEIGARGRVTVDVADDASVEAMVAFAVEQFGGLDWACNIAGIAPEPKPFVDHSHRRLAAHDRRQSERCLLLHATRAAADADAGTRRRHRQHVVGGRARAGAGSAAVHRGQARRARAHETGGAGVRTQPASGSTRCLPGQTETGADARLSRRACRTAVRRMLRRFPMKRMATPLEIAQAVVWLCSTMRAT